jgi:hypothetical protein
MLDDVFDNFRKASESSLQMQQELFKQWTGAWMSAGSNASPVTPDGLQTFLRRWNDLLVDSMQRQRSALDALHASGIQVIEQTFRLTEARSPEDYRHRVEELWRKSFDAFRDHSEAQLRDFQKMIEKWAEMMPRS